MAGRVSDPAVEYEFDFEREEWERKKGGRGGKREKRAVESSRETGKIHYPPHQLLKIRHSPPPQTRVGARGERRHPALGCGASAPFDLEPAAAIPPRVPAVAANWVCVDVTGGRRRFDPVAAGLSRWRARSRAALRRRRGLPCPLRPCSRRLRSW